MNRKGTVISAVDDWRPPEERVHPAGDPMSWTMREFLSVEAAAMADTLRSRCEIGDRAAAAKLTAAAGMLHVGEYDVSRATCLKLISILDKIWATLPEHLQAQYLSLAEAGYGPKRPIAWGK